MRLSHRGGRTVHLSCGTDLRPARDLTDIIAQLDAYAADARSRHDADTLGLSLWLPPAPAAALAVDTRSRARLRAELDARGLEVVTLSGLRYGGTAPGEDHHQPDWSTVERLEYTLDLARVLVDLLPDDAVRGSVSTIGIGRRAGWDTHRERAGNRILGRLSSGLAEIAWQTGRAVRVGLRPEPGAVMDSVEQIAAALARVDRDRVGVCLDLASLACTWQDPIDVLTRLAAAGISVIRVQLDAAVEVAHPGAAGDVLSRCAAGTVAYQVTTPAGGYADDTTAAQSGALPGPWRVRYPLPLHTAPTAPLTATSEVSVAALRHLMGGQMPACEHLDVHTAPGEEPADAGGHPAVADALAYAKDLLVDCGLRPMGACAAR